ncbi:MAG: hypothetical protein Q8M88_14460 [Phenylobacterium sp.]|nr:hypothetical protein [Phenylobacterium sp.]
MGSRTVERSGVQAFSAQCPQGLSDAASVQWMKATNEAARRVVGSTLLYGLTSPRQAAFAGRCGATHASIRE